MPLHSNKSEEEILNFIFKENSLLEDKENEKNINAYYTIKHHMPSSVFKTGKLKFNYNKGVSYIQANYENTRLFRIPNNKNNLIEIICPADKNFIKSLDISDIKKEKFIRKYRDSKLKFWYIEITTDDILNFSSTNWESFNITINNLLK